MQWVRSKDNKAKWISADRTAQRLLQSMSKSESGVKISKVSQKSFINKVNYLLDTREEATNWEYLLWNKLFFSVDLKTCSLTKSIPLPQLSCREKRLLEDIYIIETSAIQLYGKAKREERFRYQNQNTAKMKQSIGHIFLLFSCLSHKATFTLSHVLIAKFGFEEEEEKSPVSAWQVLESQGQMESVSRSQEARGALERYVWMAVGEIMCSLFKDVHLSSPSEFRVSFGALFFLSALFHHLIGTSLRRLSTK